MKFKVAESKSSTCVNFSRISLNSLEEICRNFLCISIPEYDQSNSTLGGVYLSILCTWIQMCSYYSGYAQRIDYTFNWFKTPHDQTAVAFSSCFFIGLKSCEHKGWPTYLLIGFVLNSEQKPFKETTAYTTQTNGSWHTFFNSES